MKIKPSWIKNSLGYDNNLFIYQDKQMFNYSVDTILLANLMTLNSKVNYVLEIGTNNCALSIFLSQRDPNLKIDALEIQAEAIELAKHNLKMNQLENQINLIHQDFNDYWKEHNLSQSKKYDAIVCNPPFYRKETKIKQGISKSLLQATHEISLNLEQIILGAAKIIEQKGYLALIIPPERIVDCFTLMRQYGFEPKRVKMIHPRINQKAILAFIEARYQTGWGTLFEENIYLHPEDKSDHKYLPEVIKLYQPLKKSRS